MEDVICEGGSNSGAEGIGFREALGPGTTLEPAGRDLAEDLAEVRTSLNKSDLSDLMP